MRPHGTVGLGESGKISLHRKPLNWSHWVTTQPISLKFGLNFSRQWSLFTPVLISVHSRLMRE